MDFINTKKEWQISFNDTIQNIENSIIEKNDDYPELIQFKALSKWLISNTYNPYSYMPKGYENFLSNPFDTDNLLKTLHHAICDDGDVSFVKMVNENEVLRVFMVFVWKNEDDFTAICQKENEQFIKSYISSRERFNEFAQSLNEKNPEKNIQIKSKLNLDSFAFVAHNNPIEFIKDVEDFQLKEEAKLKKFDDLSKQRKKKSV